MNWGCVISLLLLHTTTTTTRSLRDDEDSYLQAFLQIYRCVFAVMIVNMQKCRDAVILPWGIFGVFQKKWMIIRELH